MEPLREAEKLAKHAWEVSGSFSSHIKQLQAKLDSCYCRYDELRRCRHSAGDALATRLREAELEVELANLAIARRGVEKVYEKMTSAYADMIGAIDVAPVLQCCPE